MRPISLVSSRTLALLALIGATLCNVTWAQKPAAPAVSSTAPTTAPTARVPAPPAVAPFHTPQIFCREMVKRLPNVNTALCARAQLQANGAKSVLGRSIFQRDVVSSLSLIHI